MSTSVSNEINDTDKDKVWCVQCSKFLSKSYWSYHNRMHTATKLKCEFPGCDKEYVKAQELLVHQRVKHTHEKPHKCPEPECDKSFPSYHELLTHKRIHSDARNFMCPVNGCGKAFKTYNVLYAHKFRHGEQIHLCPHDGCTARYKVPQSLRRHIKEKHSQKVVTLTSGQPPP